MKFKLNHIIKSILLFLFAVSLSCDLDDLPGSPNDDQAALGEVRSLVIKPGFNKVLIEGVIDDPDVSEVKIYWNDRSESVSVPVSNSGEENTFEIEIKNLGEKLYIFEVQTFDSQGGKSDIVSAGTKVYGPAYAEGLENRTIVSSLLNESDLNIVFEPLDLTTGILGTELIYENTDGEEKEMLISTNKDVVNIPDFKSGSTLEHRSFFLYSPLSLDTIYTDYTDHKPFVLPKLENAAVPFIAEATSGRWGTLAGPWITNEAAKNHDGHGGWDEKNGNIFNLESGWGAPFITDGKIYQVLSAEPAPSMYQLKIEVLSTNQDTNPDGAYFVIAKGNGLPDVSDVETAPEVLGYQRIGTAGSYTVEFSVDATTEISIGEVTTQQGNFYCNIIFWELGLAPN